MEKRPLLVYYSPDCFTDTDITVIRHLASHFRVVWFYMYESLQAKVMRYKPEKAKEYAERYGITLEIVDPKMRRRNPKNILFYKRLAKRINNYNPDIVYACSIFPFWTFCYRHIKCPNKVLGIHDVSLHSYKFSLAKQWIQHNKENWLKRFINIFTFSPNQHDLLKSRLGKDSTMVGMSYKDFGKSEATPPTIDNGVKILFFGTISLYKGLDLFILALEELRQVGVKNLYLTIAGKGESWEECKSLIHTQEMYNLQVRFIDNDEIPDMMSSHHFLALPYRNATQSGPLAAAIGYGLPVIAPDFGCFADTVNEEASVLYKKGELTTALRSISEMTQDDYAKMRRSMLLLREEYSEERIANNYIQAFKNILYDDK